VTSEGLFSSPVGHLRSGVVYDDANLINVRIVCHSVLVLNLELNTEVVLVEDGWRQEAGGKTPKGSAVAVVERTSEGGTLGERGPVCGALRRASLGDRLRRIVDDELYGDILNADGGGAAVEIDLDASDGRSIRNRRIETESIEGG